MTNKTLPALFSTIRSLLEQDLLNPRIEACARATLKELRQRGIRFENHDLKDDCICCLDLALMSACEAMEGYRGS